MIANFLRPPQTPSEWAADLLRIAGVVGVVAALVWFGVTAAGIVALALPALMAPRFLGARAGFDLVYGATVLVAAWSNVFGWYRSIPGWDLLLHVVCTGVLAAMSYIALVWLEVVPNPQGAGTRRRTPMVVVPALALALGAIWELIEWAGKSLVTDEIFVTYADTIGDLAADGVGGVVAGLLVARVRLTRWNPTSRLGAEQAEAAEATELS